MSELAPSSEEMRDHGGDLARAMASHGGAAADWLDLSTGINATPYPFAVPPAESWARLPGAPAVEQALAAARRAYDVAAEAEIVAAAGAQALIQLAPRLRAPGTVAIVTPTYNEHAAAFAAEGWRVRPVADPEDAVGADALVLVNPNNPDGRRWTPEALLSLCDRVGLVIVDESFADPHPELSLAPLCGRPGLVVLRSFGKFYGLAGARLGFALGAPAEIATLRERLGPWAVSGPALAIGAAALADADWAVATRARLAEDAARLDALTASAGWALVGGTALFRTYRTPSALAAQERLAAHRVWSRIFPYSRTWLRLGLPGPAADWDRLAQALS